MIENFPHALRLVLVDEGGLDDDPHDHGGRTAHGIIQREYDGFRARHGKPRQDVWKITTAEYTEIYHDRYWMPWCDRLPSGLDYAFFDDCVNTGPAQAAKNLQIVLGVRVDGFMGDVTLGAAADIAEGRVENDDIHKLITDYCNQRRKFYRHLAQFPRYGKGWLARVAHVEKGAQSMIVIGAENVHRNGFDDDLKSQASAKANSSDTVKPVSGVSAEKSATASVSTGIAGGVMDQLSTVTAQLTPLQDAIHIVKYVLLALALGAAAYTLYAMWHSKKVDAATG